MQVVEPLQSLSADVGNLPLLQGPSGMVNLLQGAPSAELHADPQAVIPEVAANVGHHIGVTALTQDGDFLLEGADVVPWV